MGRVYGCKRREGGIVCKRGALRVFQADLADHRQVGFREGGEGEVGIMFLTWRCGRESEVFQNTQGTAGRV